MNRPVELVKRKEHNYLKHPPVGIDLGTTNSTAAYFVHDVRNMGAFKYNFNGKGYNDRTSLFPSVLYLTQEDEKPIFIGGRGAYARMVTEPDHVAVAIKRRMGDPAPILLAGQSFSAVSLYCEMICELLKDLLSADLEAPAGIVVTVPYYFKQNQNYDTRQAVEIALKRVFAAYDPAQRPPLLALLPEPIAAAIYYISTQIIDVIDRKVLVFDLGGGTLDITVFHLKINNRKVEFEVLASSGDSRLGGEEFDALLLDHILREEEVNFDGLTPDMQKVQREMIKAEVVKVKESLSSVKKAPLIVSNLPNGTHLDREVSREEFERLLTGDNSLGRNYIREMKDLADKAVNKAKVSGEEIHSIFLTGGSSKIPSVKQMLKSAFPQAHFAIEDEHIYHAVAKGAAIYAAYLLDRQMDHTHFPFNRQVANIEFIIRNIHNLGVETQKGRFDVVVPENVRVPEKRTRIYHPLNYIDEQKSRVSLKINVYQGESPTVSENTLIGAVNVPEAYTHGRKIEKNELPVHVTFKVSDTSVAVDVHVPQGKANKEDLTFTEHIHLEQKK